MYEQTNEQDNRITLEDLRPRPEKKKTFSEHFIPRLHPGILFDPRKCTGCGTCEMVCSSRNTSRVAPASASIKVIRDENRIKNFAILCQHCRTPLCVEACPTRAIEKGEDGIVRINKLFCVSCGLCTMACPEAAPLQDPTTGEINKCDMCEGDPQCVKYCPSGALTPTGGKRFRWIKGLRWSVQTLSFLLMAVILIGTFCSLKAGALSLSCPTGVLQNIASSGTIVLVWVFSTFILLGLTLLAGRFFCGWICPFGFFLDLVDKITPKKVGLPSFLKSRMAKYGILAGAVGGSCAFGSQVFCPICPIGSICRSYGATGTLNGANMGIVAVLGGLEIAERRVWCRYFCPVGAVLALCAKIGLIKIVIGANQCKKFSCIQCAEVCPMGIIDANKLREGVSPDIPMTECITCMRCIDRCPYGAAKIRFRWQKTVPGNIEL